MDEKKRERKENKLFFKDKKILVKNTQTFLTYVCYDPSLGYKRVHDNMYVCGNFTSKKYLSCVGALSTYIHTYTHMWYMFHACGMILCGIIKIIYHIFRNIFFTSHI